MRPASPAVRTIAAGLLALTATLAACQPSAPVIDMTDPRVSAGAPRSCADLQLSPVRCTLVTLRGRALLDEQRPNHGGITSQALHAVGDAPAGQSPLPEDTVVPAVVVFAMADGSRIGVPVLCPRTPDESDQACNPLIQ